MSEIFKLHYMNDNNIEKLMIFCGNHKDYCEKHLDKILNNNTYELFQQGNIEIIYIEDYIHKDESIEDIKLKIMSYDNDITFEEIYLYCYNLKHLNFANILKLIENNDKNENYIIENLKNNIEDQIFRKYLDFQKKEPIKTKDILYMENEKVLVKTPIGQKFNIENYILYNSVSPFDIKSEEYILNDNIIKTNNNLLFETDIYNNDIYLCKFSNKNIKKVTELYYFYLFEKDIFDLETLSKKRIELKDKAYSAIINKKIYNESTNEIFNNYNEKTFKEYVPKMGVLSIKLKINSVNNMFVPLDLVFKTLHASETFPLIKVNLGNKLEKLYRIYSTYTSYDGRKIPYLKKTDILRIQRQIGNHKGLTIYVNVKNKPYFIEIKENGDILVLCEFEKHVDIKELDTLLQDGINKILLVIKNKFEKNGYKINFFTGILSENVTVSDCNFLFKLQNEKKLSFKQIECMENFFTIKSNKELIYKRIKNYNQLNKIMGFPIIFEKDKKDKNYYNIVIYNIDNMMYIYYIKIFLKSVFDLLLNNDENNIKTVLCKNKKEVIQQPLYLSDEEKEEDDVDIDKDDDEDEDEDEDFFDVKSNKGLDEEDEQDEEEDEEEDEDNDEDEDEDKDEDKDEDEDEEGDENEDDENLSIPSLGSLSLGSELGESLGGAKKGDERNYAQNRIQKYDKNLFLKFNTADNLYSRSCAANAKKQPIIISKEEKEIIDKNHAGSYSESLEYSTDPNTQYYYICPRYWCSEENISLTEDQVSKNGDEITSKYCSGKVMEFDDKKQHHKGESDYIYNNPGFNKNSCIPCCFKISQKAKNIEAKNKCLDDYKKERVEKQEEDDEDKDKDMEDEITKVSKEEIKDQELSLDYIQQPNKFPLEQNRFGYLPLNIQKFIQNDLKNCSLKGDFKCLLRIGTNQDNNQSFISCLSTIYSFTAKEDSVISNSELKKKIYNSENFTLDNFLSYMNGNLVQYFYDDKRNINIANYISSSIYKKIDTKNKKHMKLLERCINSFESFKTFLKSDDSKINHHFIWDILSHSKNNLLFEKPVNLVIFEINDDIESNYIELLCPSNHYSKNNFKDGSDTYMIIKNKDLYEPIFYCEREKSSKPGEKFKINILTSFSSRILKKFNLDDLKVLMKNIKNIYLSDDNCGVLSSIPSKYKFKVTEKTLRYSEDIVDKLISINYGITKQIINYNGKCIGFFVIKTKNNENNERVPVGESFMVPIYPSSILKDVKIIFIDDETLLGKYTTVKKKLFDLNEESSNEIPCKPISKVIDKDNFIVGIITETKQFIPVEPKEDKIEVGDYNLINIVKSNDLFSDKNKKLFYSDAELFLREKNERDKKTNNYIKKIKLENRFYDCFRNFMRIEINKISNLSTKKELSEILENENLSNSEKKDKISVIIKELSKDLIVFQDDFNEEKITNIDLEENVCFDENKKKIIVPYTNLISEKNNEKIYFERFYDEVIRYDYIRKFVFDVDNYLNLVKQNYNLKDDEFIIPQTLLTSKYFENLNKTKSDLNKLYDTSYPQLHIPYSNIYKMVKMDVSEEDIFEDREEDDNKVFEILKEKKKINRCPNGFRRNTSGVCVPINNEEWKIYSENEKELIYESIKIPGKRVLINK